MRTIYHTILTSRRHREIGYCEDGDFGEINLILATEEEAPLVCIIKDYQLNQEIRLFENKYYTDMTFWNKGQKIFKEKQGRLTEKTAIRLMVQERNKAESSDSFYPSPSRPTYLMVGKRIYEFYCNERELNITQTGNLMFGDWWTLDIEPHHTNKKNVLFNKKNFDRELQEAKDFIKKRNKNRTTKISFSHPRIKWFHPELIENKKKEKQPRGRNATDKT